MDATDSLQAKLKEITHNLQEAIDMSIELRKQSQENKDKTTRLWEEFLGQLFGYIKQRSKESKDNLLSGISWARMKLF